MAIGTQQCPLTGFISSASSSTTSIVVARVSRLGGDRP